MSDADGQMKVTEIATNPLVQDLLSHDVSQYNHHPMNYSSFKSEFAMFIAGGP